MPLHVCTIAGQEVACRSANELAPRLDIEHALHLLALAVFAPRAPVGILVVGADLDHIVGQQVAQGRHGIPAEDETPVHIGAADLLPEQRYALFGDYGARKLLDDADRLVALLNPRGRCVEDQRIAADREQRNLRLDHDILDMLRALLQ